MSIERILVPVDFSPSSDAALDYALAVADSCGAEVELLHVWRPSAPSESATVIFAETPEGLAMEQRLSAAETDHPTRVCGRLEFGDEPSRVILAILERERFDLVVMGREGEGQHATPVGHVAANVVATAPCRVCLLPQAPPDGEGKAA